MELGSRQEYNFKIIQILNDEVTSEENYEKNWKEVLNILKITKHSEETIDILPFHYDELISQLIDFFTEYPDQRFLQGLINYGLITDSSDWFEESKETYEKICKR